MKTLPHALFLPLFLVPLFAAGCGGSSNTSAPAVPPASPAVAKFVLGADPGTAVGVDAARQAGASDAVTVQGRIANIVKGYAVFTLMDTSLPYCGETNKEDHCPTPWDYCCETAKTRTDHSMVVELRSADGKPLSTPALPDLRLLDTVKVTGKLSQDAAGNYVLAATGVFRTQRPELPDTVRWPQ